MDVDADSTKGAASVSPPTNPRCKISTEEVAVRYEPSIGTGTGSEVVNVVREGEHTYRVTTNDGCQEVVDETTLKQLPQWMARHATLVTREQMAAKKAGNEGASTTAKACVPEDDNGSTAQSTVDEPGGEPSTSRSCDQDRPYYFIIAYSCISLAYSCPCLHIACLWLLIPAYRLPIATYACISLAYTCISLHIAAYRVPIPAYRCIAAYRVHIACVIQPM